MFLLLTDGTSYLLLVDGTSKMLLSEDVIVRPPTMRRYRSENMPPEIIVNNTPISVRRWDTS